jgi:hypothetical protein
MNKRAYLHIFLKDFLNKETGVPADSSGGLKDCECQRDRAEQKQGSGRKKQ